MKYYSRSNDPHSRLVQNIFRGLTKCGLLVKCKKTDLICKNNKTYETTYRVPFIVSQQRINKKFIMMNNEIIQLKTELRKRSKALMNPGINPNSFPTKIPRVGFSKYSTCIIATYFDKYVTNKTMPKTITYNIAIPK